MSIDYKPDPPHFAAPDHEVDFLALADIATHKTGVTIGDIDEGLFSLSVTVEGQTTAELLESLADNLEAFTRRIRSL